MTRSAVEVVRIYIEEAWNKGRYDLVPELCANPVIRNEANSRIEVDHEAQMARIRTNYDALRPIFDFTVFHGDDQHVTLVWDVKGRDPGWRWCGIEIFRVENGRIAEVWNAPYVDGQWGASGVVSARVGTGADQIVPIMSAALSPAGGTLSVPVDARSIGRWIGQILTVADSTQLPSGMWQHNYAPGVGAKDLLISQRDGKEADLSFHAQVDSLTLAFARSGLINADVALSTLAPGQPPATRPAPAADELRLADPFGSFDRDGQSLGTVCNSTITLRHGGAGASGTLSLRLHDEAAAQCVAGAGDLSLGWRHEGALVQVSGQAVLSAPIRGFVDGDGYEASFDWNIASVTAQVVNDLAA